ncbi:MAG: sterol desaturase family protein, partial [Bacteroidota bacterium]
MEKPTFTIEQILSMDLPPIIIYAAPVMFIMVLIEWYIRTRELHEHYDKKDGFSALIIGLGNIAVSALVKVALFTIILFFYNMVPWFIPPEWWSYVLCVIAIDFCRYWSHRISHEQRFWWATHVT